MCSPGTSTLRDQVNQRMALTTGEFHNTDSDVLAMSLEERRLFLEIREKMLDDLKAKMNAKK